MTEPGIDVLIDDGEGRARNGTRMASGSGHSPYDYGLTGSQFPDEADNVARGRGGAKRRPESQGRFL